MFAGVLRADHTLTFWLAVHDESGPGPLFTVDIAGARLAAQALRAGEQTVRVVVPAAAMTGALRIKFELDPPRPSPAWRPSQSGKRRR